MTSPINESFMNDALQHVQKIDMQVENATFSFAHLLAAKVVQDASDENGMPERAGELLDLAVLDSAKQVVSLLQAVAKDPTYNKFMAELAKLQAGQAEQAEQTADSSAD